MGNNLAARFSDRVEHELLPELEVSSNSPHDPVIVRQYPSSWTLLGAGNYAAVFCHPDYPEFVVKVYAPGRPGLEEEAEVYRRLGDHPAFSQCLFEGKNFLILKRLEGVTLWNALHRGIAIPPQIIRDIDRALDYARSLGLNPHDIHGKNVMMTPARRGVVVDVSDFLHADYCSAWDDLKRAYRWIYRPILLPLKVRVPSWTLDWVRAFYRKLRQMRSRKFRGLFLRSSHG
ncbi:serine/threonine protein kinase [Leptolyngbya sp. FACHB-711]|uniref:serine/threonine protein kinase n=1 Tax=unclassified Leptolyngbya TaxID=2650499 RepID=UPI00168264A6|nr:serine/threonine protein kinase [Leptolyngbya sp. FACHB-711]MBD1849228.1 serine/threonine protein kinase [Cyanobacteria bacterium FACHB-502]MBD2025192.1 serine/threonine protein kinase [Leptolyngbya sp. FACHB-711]